jgi:O-antigen/teichoic acid export membrane protein
MAIVHSVAVTVPLLVATIVIFSGNFREYKPSFKWYDSTYAKGVLKLGGQFLFAQLAYMAIMSTNEILINTTFSSEAVVEYQAYYRIFTLMSTVFTLMLTPLWSAITKAITEKNLPWIKGIIKKFYILATLGSICELAIVVIIKPIMKIWLQNDFANRVSHISAFYVAIIGCLMMFNGVLSSLANGTGNLKTQIICFFIGAILKIPLSIVLVNITDSWNGVLIANIVCMGIYTFVQPLTLKKSLKQF